MGRGGWWWRSVTGMDDTQALKLAELLAVYAIEYGSDSGDLTITELVGDLAEANTDPTIQGRVNAARDSVALAIA